MIHLKIAIIGLGYVGLPLAALLSGKFEVVGFDTDASKVKKLDKREEILTEPGLKEILNKSIDSGKLKFTTTAEDIQDSQVKIITVGTPYDEKKRDVDYSFLDSAIEIVCRHIKKGDVVVLKSTVPVGTTSKRVVKALKANKHKVPEDVGVVFSPERIVEGQAIHDYATLPKIIGASDDRSFEIFSKVAQALGGRIIRVSNPETAEMVKMTDNYARFAFLGVVNELALVCEKVGVDVMEMLRAAKEDYKRNDGLLIPGPGVGGSCLNKDPFILQSNMEKEGLSLHMVDAAKEINSNMPAHVSELVGKFRKGSKIVVVAGVAFKGDTDDTRFTPSFKIKETLEAQGKKVRLSDPFVKSVDGIISDIYKASKGSDVFVVVTDHQEYKKIDLKKLKSIMNTSPLIIDARALIKRSEAESLGFEYHGLGRL